MPGLETLVTAAAVMPSATCRPVEPLVSVVLAQACRDCRTRASPRRGEPGPVLRYVHVDQNSIGKVAGITVAMTETVIATPSKIH
jgi:hypothetical protein